MLRKLSSNLQSHQMTQQTFPLMLIKIEESLEKLLMKRRSEGSHLKLHLVLQLMRMIYP